MENTVSKPLAHGLDAVARSAATADVVSSASDPDSAAATSVLSQVAQRTQNRRRRRGKPPGWTIWVAKQAGQGRTFFSHTLPIWLMGRREELISYATSLLLLTAIALILASCALPPSVSESLFGLIVTRLETNNEELEVLEIIDAVQPEEINDLTLNSSMMQLISDLEDGDTSIELNSLEDKQFALELKPTDAELKQIFTKGEFGGRSKAGRQAAVKHFGGTAESEAAVNSGLKWLLGTQQKDGSWNFSKPGPAASPGSFRRTEVGATSLALLCFLGAGHTHVQEGPYRQAVEKGLAYIGSQAQIVQGTADLRGAYEGNAGMYVQGLATICISEAHALEHRDEDLEKLTGMAVRFIERAQDPFGGGWRYRPREEGDTSVVGWQVMALQSAKSGRIKVSSKSLRLAREFLRNASGDRDGSTYKYRPVDDKATNTMTAVGLLCRMYLGWGKDFEPLKKGVYRLSAVGPSKTNMYYNYYATQVLHHWGDELWKKWNLQLREQLVRTQISEGPAAGSWAPTDNHSTRAGQVYQTALCILTLEVYYRHLPIYKRLENGPTDPATVE